MDDVVEIAKDKYHAIITGGLFCRHPELDRLLTPSIIKCYPPREPTRTASVRRMLLACRMNECTHCLALIGAQSDIEGRWGIINGDIQTGVSYTGALEFKHYAHPMSKRYANWPKHNEAKRNLITIHGNWAKSHTLPFPPIYTLDWDLHSRYD